MVQLWNPVSLVAEVAMVVSRMLAVSSAKTSIKWLMKWLGWRALICKMIHSCVLCREKNKAHFLLPRMHVENCAKIGYLPRWNTQQDVSSTFLSAWSYYIFCMSTLMAIEGRGTCYWMKGSNVNTHYYYCMCSTTDRATQGLNVPVLYRPSFSTTLEIALPSPRSHHLALLPHRVKYWFI